MALQAATAAGAGRERDKLRASDADRDRAAEMLGTAYTEGRLSKDEYDARLEAAFSARTYADLNQVTGDLPQPAPAVRPAGPATVLPGARVNGYAIASFACGLGQFLVGPLATIPAIILGHKARSQIRRTGEQGAFLAFAGLVLGWATVTLAVVILLAVALVAAAGLDGAAQMP